jgi:hypothetical protein
MIKAASDRKYARLRNHCKAAQMLGCLAYRGRFLQHGEIDMLALGRALPLHLLVNLYTLSINLTTMLR